MPAPDKLDPVWTREHRRLCDAVREAGELALDMQAGGLSAWDKRDGTPVSDADIAVDRLLGERLRTRGDGIAWLSEEAADDYAARAGRPAWVVDPVDGTSAYIKGSAQWCVGASLVVAGRPVVAAAYAPAQDLFFDAVAGGGTRLNGQPVRVSRAAALEGAHVIAHESALRRDRWRPPAPSFRRGMTTSLILRQCLVAAGRFDAAIAFGRKSDWDLAPGDLIVSEAGGRCTDLHGRAFVFNGRSTRQHGLLAGTPAILDDIVERLHTGHAPPSV